MLRNAASKVMWGGRATVFMVGLAMIVALLLGGLLAPPAHAFSTFTVNTRSDHPPGLCLPLTPGEPSFDCTLREAINHANNNSNPTETDIIHFAIPDNPSIPGLEVKTITPTAANGPLPDISERVIINGYTQSGSHPNTLALGNDAVLKIVLNGANAGTAHGLKITSNANVVRGLVINNFDFDGISVEGDNNKIEGNFIGTDPAGTHDRGNGEIGVGIDSGTSNTVGGTSAAKRNLISGNDFHGVFLSAGSASNTVLGNYIGTAKGGNVDLGNTSSGVSIFGAANNAIGDGTAAAANTIAFNGSDGVTIDDFSLTDDANGNRVLRNSIFANVGLGIDLNSDGPTPNDTKDQDSGPNTLQNKPNLTSATTTGTSTTIKGSLNSTPEQTFRLEFFSNPSENEGKRFLGQKIIDTNTNGNRTFAFSATKAVAAGQRIIATATGAGGNTSEFSAPRVVVQQ